MDLFVKKLKQDGITDLKIEQTSAGKVIKLLEGEMTITIEDNNTHINCGGKQSLRLKVRDLLMQCISNF